MGTTRSTSATTSGATRRRLTDRLRDLWITQRELHERRDLLDRPWEEEFLHWAFDGESWRLHGTLMPPTRGRHRTTGSGWCPGLVRAAHATTTRSTPTP